MKQRRADRLSQLPPYLFVEIDRKRRDALAAGKAVINLGIGDPDMPTPGFVVDRLARELRNPAHHRYPAGAGVAEFVDAAIAFCERRFGVTVDRTQITALIGSKEGIGHLPIAVVNPGQGVLIPEPGYPVYTAGAIFAGGVPHVMPLTAERGWLPDLDGITADVARSARLMFLNYPNNPTGAVADLGFFRRAVRFARDNDIILVHDAAYSEVFFDTPPPSILQVEGAFDVAIEFHSLSKTFNMTGWRIAFAVGNPDVVAALAMVKDNLDSGQFNAIQLAAAEALTHFDHLSVRAMTDLYRERRDLVVDGLSAAGIDGQGPDAGFYVWAPCPAGYTSMEFAAKVLDEAAVILIPGVGFGPAGEGYFRISLTVATDDLREAMRRIGSVTW